MKVAVTLILIGFLSFLCIDGYKDRERDCRGVVIDKFIGSPYEYRSGKTTCTAPAQFILIFKPDSADVYLKKDVEENTYYHFEKGNRIIMQISPSELTTRIK